MVDKLLNVLLMLFGGAVLAVSLYVMVTVAMMMFNWIFGG